jgi:hypothetical protein
VRFQTSLRRRAAAALILKVSEVSQHQYINWSVNRTVQEACYYPSLRLANMNQQNRAPLQSSILRDKPAFDFPQFASFNAVTATNSQGHGTQLSVIMCDIAVIHSTYSYCFIELLIISISLNLYAFVESNDDFVAFIFTHQLFTVLLIPSYRLAFYFSFIQFSKG